MIIIFINNSTIVGSMRYLNYRPEIDGLRGLAVLSVVIFHANKGILPGGFIGVDIFFVISGFLITKIIYGSAIDGGFSYKEFYHRRIKRILPVFFFVMMIAIIVSYLIMLPYDFLYFTKSAVSTLFFASNMFFGRSVDYFSPNTSEYPLLHTWSLSVEEQYYILFPVILLMIYKRGWKTIISLISFLLVLSVSVSCLLPLFPGLLKYNYYWLPSRAYELMIGSLTAIWLINKKIPRKLSSWMPFVGMVLILISLVFIKENDKYPGALGLIPCLGTAMILLHEGDAKNYINRLLSTRVAVFFGLISYSLYLWHWPTLSFVRYIFNESEITIGMLVFCIIFMIGISWASWAFIEKPIRHSSLSFNKSVALFYILPLIVISSLYFVTSRTNGIPSRYGENENTMEREITYMKTSFCHNGEFGNCTFGDLKYNPNTYMFGDSQAGHYSGMLDEVGKKLGFSFVAKSVDACYPLLDMDGREPSSGVGFYSNLCQPLIKKSSIDYKKYKNIVMSGLWSKYFIENPDTEKWVDDQIRELTSEGHNVFIFEQIPVFGPGIYEHALRRRYGFLGHIRESKDIEYFSGLRTTDGEKENAALKRIVSKYKNAYFIEPVEALGSSADKDLPFYKGVLVYKDSDHLNEYGSRMIGNDVYQKIMAFKVMANSER